MSSFKLPLRASIKLTDTNDKFKRKTLEPIQRDIEKKFKLNAISIRAKILDLITEAISESPEFISLGVYAQGELAPEFGFRDGASVQTALLTAIRAHTKVKINPPKLAGARKPQSIIVIELDRNGLLGDPAGWYRSGRYRVGWLRWLLESGTTPTVMDFSITYDLTKSQQTKVSRSGLALMIKGGYYTVPAEYSGTSGNNFITRALDEAYQTKIIDYMSRILRY